MESSESKTLRNRNERILILLLSFVAAFRVLIFSAAFPFFSNVDEDLHFDLITQYSHGRPPRTFETVKEETLFWMVPYGSLEFLNTSDQFPGGKFPPPLWKQSGPKAESEFVAAKAEWSTETNFESSQPPLYYIVASLWWWIGKHIGFGDIQSGPVRESQHDVTGCQLRPLRCDPLSSATLARLRHERVNGQHDMQHMHGDKTKEHARCDEHYSSQDSV